MVPSVRIIFSHFMDEETKKFKNLPKNTIKKFRENIIYVIIQIIFLFYCFISSWFLIIRNAIYLQMGIICGYNFIFALYQCPLCD